jgi:uncharacterized protein DUF2852
MGCCSLRWNERMEGAQNGGRDDRGRRASSRQRWEPWEIALMVSGFVVFWPAGLAILTWILWRHSGRSMPRFAVLERLGARPLAGSRPHANSAFEDWKRGELDRLEQERRRLAQAEQEFSDFLDQLKRARDREEFDRFMAARNAQSNGTAG